jgi:ribosomal protein S18 acetylase RimI-like enzyme
METTVERIEAVTPELVLALRSLLPHLSESAPMLDEDGIAAIVSQRGVSLLVARGDGGRILGTVTLVCFQIPSGRRARIESLVVAPAARRVGIGRTLCKAALEYAQAEGAGTVDLTSAHSRVEANALYRSLGFVLRETNVYRMKICDGLLAFAAEPGVAGGPGPRWRTEPGR